MLYFNSDYLEGAHPAVMKLLNETNMAQTDGYGEDEYCDRARRLIREACNAPDALVQFLVGGTQTNMTVISAALRPHQGVLCAQTGHINVHETGAVESSGHKVLALPSEEGKITAEAVQRYVNTHRADPAFEHMVQPGMVYISHPTEVGTSYTKAELADLSRTCRELGLYLFLDGARLAYGLAAEEMNRDKSVEDSNKAASGHYEDSGLDLPTIAELCDVFYIGGTKCGALMGEAVVITAESLKKDFRYMIKQKGAMLAKGRLLGVQFVALFENGLYEEIGRHGICLSNKLRKAIKEIGIPLYQENKTNQIFVILEDQVVEALSDRFTLSFTERIDETHVVMRICTSWATSEENVDKLIEALREIYKSGK